MKKSALFLALFLTLVVAMRAQTYTRNNVGDTVHWFDPTYIYGPIYDTNPFSEWSLVYTFDYFEEAFFWKYLQYLPTVYYVYRLLGAGEHINGKAFKAREPLKIIGAAVCAYDHPNNAIYRECSFSDLDAYMDTTKAGRLPEYLQLYTFDGDNNPQLVTQAPWYLTDPHRYMLSQAYSSDPRIPHLYEVYFDKGESFSVNGRFMIAETHNNNRLVRAPACGESEYEHGLYGDSVDKWEHLETRCLSLTNSSLRVLYCPDSNCPREEWWFKYENYPFFHDTAYNNFYAIFPIMDTSYVPLPPECPQVQRVEARPAVGCRSSITWSQNTNHSPWQVVYGPAGFDPNSAIKYWCYEPQFLTDPLDTAGTYQAYVRGWCAGDSIWGEWSAPVDFRVTDTATFDPTGIRPADSDLDHFTNLFPNPAQDHVQVFSSFGLRGVEAYSLDGQQMLNIPVHGLSATFSTASWPRGTYIVLLRTSRGTATKKMLLVEM